MREHKYRAWDKEKKEFHFWDIITQLHSCIPSLLGVKKENIIITQFTGLLDKNGKEIYEGDILRYADRRKLKNLFLIEEGMVEDECSGIFCNGLMIHPKYDKMIIIGNKFENTKLLE